MDIDKLKYYAHAKLQLDIEEEEKNMKKLIEKINTLTKEIQEFQVTKYYNFYLSNIDYLDRAEQEKEKLNDKINDLYNKLRSIYQS